MAGTTLQADTASLPPAGTTWRVQPAETLPVDAATRPADQLDIVQALAELSTAPGGEADSIADGLLQWLTPRLRHADTLTQARIVPLLGIAADLIARGTQMTPDIARLGSVALEQELRMQRALADRRAALTLNI